MLENITEQELDFMEMWHDPIAMAECLFSDYDNLALCNEEKAHIRNCQIPMLSFEYMIDKDPKLTDQENFTLKENVGTVYALGGRKFGKTVCVEKIDLPLALISLENEKIGFSSYDAMHIEGVMEEILPCLESHPVIKDFIVRVKRSPYTIQSKTGSNCIGINMNVYGKKPGAQFYQKHLTRLYIEEASFETTEVQKTRTDAISELGCVVRSAGMTNFTRQSPCGEIFYDHRMKKFIANFPQYISPMWSATAKRRAIKDHGGEESLSYRVFCDGDIVEDGVSVFDMEIIRDAINEDKYIKHFEVPKEDFNIFKNKIVVERPKNANKVFIAADIGESAPTEIGVFFEINEKYYYVYNITLYGLNSKQQEDIFKWLAYKLQANFVGLDTTDGTGRAIYRSLQESFDNENLVWVSFNSKLPVDYDKDDRGNIKYSEKDGKPKYIEEYVSEWSIKMLKDLFFESKFVLPVDHKFTTQINSVISLQSANRIIYKCIAPEDHLFQMFQVFGIMHWNCEFLNVAAVRAKKFAKSGV